MFGLFFFVGAQSIMGFLDYNSTEEHGQPPVGYARYLRSGDFVDAAFKNWESEILQMGLYVLLTAVRFERDSAESKDPKTQHPDDAGYAEDIDTDLPGQCVKVVGRLSSTSTL